MSPRAAWRLEALGFEQVYDYMPGKADWLAHGLGREGDQADAPHAGDFVDRDPPTCAPDVTVEEAREILAESRYGFCLVLNDRRVVVGRVRRSAVEGVDASAPVESVVEPGPSTVRANVSAGALVERLADRGLRTAIVTTPGGVLIGVFSRAEAERRLE